MNLKNKKIIITGATGGIGNSLVKKFSEQGAIILGKTASPEFGHKGTTQSLKYGNTNNPWDYL